MITKDQAMTKSVFYHKTERYADGTAKQCRANGKCHTWKTRPDDFRLPVKYGFRTCFYLTPANAHEWSATDPTKTEPDEQGFVRFDPSWIPKFKGKILDWLDKIVELAGYHPRLVAENPNVLSHAGVSRRLLTPQVLREAAKATFLTAKAHCSAHNRLVALGRAKGLMEVREVDWVGFLADPVPVPKPEQKEPECPRTPSTTTPRTGGVTATGNTGRKDSSRPGGAKTSRPAPSAKGGIGPKKKGKSRRSS